MLYVKHDIALSPLFTLVSLVFDIDAVEVLCSLEECLVVWG